MDAYLEYDAKYQKDEFDSSNIIPKFFLDEDRRKVFIRQFLECLIKMHDVASVVHHDLKPGNMIIDVITGNLHIIDFDVSISPSSINTSSGSTENWEDPESNHDKSLHGRLGPHNDIYGFGKIVKEIYKAYKIPLDDYEKIIDKCICKRENRYKYAQDILSDFEECWRKEDVTLEDLSKILFPVDFSREIERYMEVFVGRKWLIEDIQQWSDSEEAARRFILLADPGVGKTAVSVAASKVLSKDCLTAFFMCNRSDSDKRSARSMVRTLAFQICKQNKKYMDFVLSSNLEERMKDFSSDDTAVGMFRWLITEPLEKLGIKVKIIIDALDEAADANGRNLVVETIASVNSPNIKWFITSRPDGMLQYLDDAIVYNLRLDKELKDKNQQDIKEYVAYRLLPIKDSGWYDLLVMKLPYSVKNFFIYAKYACDEILQSKDIGETTRYLITPRGVRNYYMDFFDRRMDYRKEIKQLFVLMTIVNNPTKQYARRILGWEMEELDDILLLLQSMVDVSSDGKLSFTHVSLPEWLLGEKSDIWRIDRADKLEDYIDEIEELIMRELLDENLLKTDDHQEALSVYTKRCEKFERKYGIKIDTLYRNYVDCLLEVDEIDKVLSFVSRLMRLPIDIDAWKAEQQSVLKSTINFFADEPLLLKRIAELLIKTSYDLTQEDNKKYKAYDFYFDLATILIDFGKYSEANSFYGESLKFASRENVPKEFRIKLSTMFESSRLKSGFQIWSADENSTYKLRLIINGWEDVKDGFKKDQGLANGLNELGSIYFEQGLYEKAYDSLSKALSIRERICQHPNADLGTTYFLVGSACYYLCRNGLNIGTDMDAREYYLKALNEFIPLYGENHVSVAQVYIALGWLFLDKKDIDNAKEFYRRSRNIIRKYRTSQELVYPLREKAYGLYDEIEKLEREGKSPTFS